MRVHLITKGNRDDFFRKLSSVGIDENLVSNTHYNAETNTFVAYLELTRDQWKSPGNVVKNDSIEILVMKWFSRSSIAPFNRGDLLFYHAFFSDESHDKNCVCDQCFPNR